MQNPSDELFIIELARGFLKGFNSYDEVIARSKDHNWDPEAVKLAIECLNKTNKDIWSAIELLDRALSNGDFWMNRFQHFEAVNYKQKEEMPIIITTT